MKKSWEAHLRANYPLLPEEYVKRFSMILTEVSYSRAKDETTTQFNKEQIEHIINGVVNMMKLGEDTSKELFLYFCAPEERRDFELRWKAIFGD